VFDGATTRLMVNASTNGGIGSFYVGNPSASSEYMNIVTSTSGTGALLFGNTTAATAGRYAGAVTYSHTANSLSFDTSSTTKMTLDTSGNLGLGVTPSAWSGGGGFDLPFYAGIAGNSSVGFVASFNAYYNSGWKYKATTAARAYVMDSADHHWYNAPSGTAGNAITFTLAMTLDSSGNLFVGTTGQRYSTCKLVVEQSASTYAGAFLGTKYSGDLSQAAVYISKYDNDNTTSQVYTRFIYNNILSGGGQINGNGASQAAFGSWSDSRLKENIVDLPSQLPNILALRPVEFDYIESEGGGHQVGFIAQEVKEIYPDLVGQRADGMFTLSDMNKNDARLIKAIQELSTQLTELKAEVATLRGA
jgi:hypothetical protein